MMKPGLTLVETLVLLAVIGALAMIGLYGGRAITIRSRMASSTSNLRNLVIANHTYASDNGRFCPADNQSNNLRWHGARRSNKGAFDPTAGLLSPYLGHSQRVGICPLFKSMVSSAVSFEFATGGYGYNACYIGGRPGMGYDRTSKLRVSELPANIQDPTHTVMFATTAYANRTGLQEYPYCEPPFWDFGNGPSAERPSPSVHFRAEGKALVAWCDGHVSAESNNRDEHHGVNPHGGDSHQNQLGWFGPTENNGWWNPRFRTAE